MILENNKYTHMKKILLVAVFAVGLTALKAQDFKKVQTALLLNQVENAKTEIDKLMQEPKAQAKAEGWFWKAKVYAALYKDDKTREKYPITEVTAAEAYKKYHDMDPDYKILKENGGQDIPFNLYVTSFSQGVKEFNAKKWDSASFYFGYAVEYSDTIFQNKWSNAKMNFDTTSILYAAYANQNNKNLEKAYHYYSRLADSSVHGKEYEDIYKFLLVSASNNKNKADFDKWLGMAKKFYPNGEWDDYEADYLNKNYTLQEKADLFDKEDAAGTLTAAKYLQFGEMFANIPKDEKDKLDSTQEVFYKNKARLAFERAYTKDTTNGIAAYNAGVLYNLEFNAIDDKMRDNIRSLQKLNAAKADIKDPKKKAAYDAQIKPQVDAIKKFNSELEKPATAVADSTILWLENAYRALNAAQDKTPAEKNCYSKSLDILYNMYSYKRDKSKADQKLFDAYDAKVKFYDQLISASGH